MKLKKVNCRKQKPMFRKKIMKSSKIDRKGKKKITNITDKAEVITRDLTQKIRHYEYLYVNQFDNVNEISHLNEHTRSQDER